MDPRKIDPKQMKPQMEKMVSNFSVEDRIQFATQRMPIGLSVMFSGLDLAEKEKLADMLIQTMTSTIDTLMTSETSEPPEDAEAAEGCC